MKTTKMELPTKVIIVDTNFVERTVRAAVCLETFKVYLEDLKRHGVSLDPMATDVANTVGSYVNDILKSISD
jgi:hypothetical protein